MDAVLVAADFKRPAFRAFIAPHLHCGMKRNLVYLGAQGNFELLREKLIGRLWRI